MRKNLLDLATKILKKYRQEAVDKYGQEVMDQALERQKVEKRRRQEPLIKSSSLGEKPPSWFAGNSVGKPRSSSQTVRRDPNVWI